MDRKPHGPFHPVVPIVSPHGVQTKTVTVTQTRQVDPTADPLLFGVDPSHVGSHCSGKPFRRHHRGHLVNRYYDPATEQFISVDPLVDQTGQTFSYAADDPVNESDPLGLYPGQHWLDSARHTVASGYDAVNDFLSNESQTLDCNAVGGGHSIFNGILDCAGDPNGPACSGGIAGVSGGNLNTKSAQYFKRANIDPEQLKDEYGYSKDGDLRVQSGSGRVYVGPKYGSADEMEPTNFRIVNGQSVFDPPSSGYPVGAEPDVEP